MKRIVLYDGRGTVLFSGNLCDLPLDRETVNREAKRLYGERTCPDRMSNVKQLLRGKILACGETLPPEAAALLKDKSAVRFTLSEE